MEYQEYITQKKELYSSIIQFIDCEKDDANFYFEDLINLIISQKIQENREELKLLIKLIIDIFDNHSRSNNLIYNIEKIFCFFKKDIKQTFTNNELFEFASDNKFLLLFLIKEQIIQIDCSIIDLFREFNCLNYFYPEIKDKINDEELENIEKEIKEYNPKLLADFENIRNCGENDSYICSLIRNDSIDEFVIYMNQTNLSVSALIEDSPFETNFFLMYKEKVSLIQYATFFGSINIFQYLKFNNAELEPSLWLFAIHSNNAEMINKLEENHINPEKKVDLLKESIICHHNAIANYIIDNLMDETPIELNDLFTQCILQHYNFEFLPTEIKTNQIFFCLFKYEYETLVNLYIREKMPESDNNKILTDKFVLNTIPEKKINFIPNYYVFILFHKYFIFNKV